MELLQRAERAKNFAKTHGRDCVAGYTGTLFDEDELRVFAPAETGSAKSGSQPGRVQSEAPSAQPPPSQAGEGVTDSPNSRGGE